MFPVFLLINAIVLLTMHRGFRSGKLRKTAMTFPMILVGFIGINMVLGGILSYCNTRTWLADTIVTSGEIVDYEQVTTYRRAKKRNGRRRRASVSTTYYPTVRFHTQTGRSITITSSVGSSQRSNAIGDSVEVRYLPTDPENAQVNEFMSIWFVTIILLVIGTPMTAVAVIIARHSNAQSISRRGAPAVKSKMTRLTHP